MLGKNLDKLIRERKTNRSEFAKYLNVSRSTLNDYLQERTYMTSDRIILCAKYFGVSVGYLFGETDNTELILRSLIENQQEQINRINTTLAEIGKKNFQ